MSPGVVIRPCLSDLDREQAFDLRRSVLCGELHLAREAARDEDDESAYLALAWLGEKPVGTGRIFKRGDFWQVERLCVLPEQRRSGIARALLGHFIGQAQTLGSHELWAVSPLAAQVFFTLYGFVVAQSQSEICVLKYPIG